MPAVYSVDHPDIRLDNFELGKLAISINAVTRGTFTLTGATNLAVADTHVTATSAISYAFKTLGGTDGRGGYIGKYPRLVSQTAGTGFTVVGAAGDTSVYDYAIVG